MKIILPLLACLLAGASEDATYTLTVDLGGEACDESVLEALEGIDGVKAAKLLPDTRWSIELTVAESRVITPAQICGKLPVAEDYQEARITVTGRIARRGETWILVARGSLYAYGIEPNDELRELVARGETVVSVSGTMGEEPSPKRFRKGAVVIEVTTAEARPVATKG